MSELLKFLSTAFAHPLNNSRKDNDLQIYHVWLSNAKRYQRFTEPHTLKGIRDSPFFQVKHLSTRIQNTKFINITSSLKFSQSIPLNFSHLYQPCGSESGYLCPFIISVSIIKYNFLAVTISIVLKRLRSPHETWFIHFVVVSKFKCHKKRCK